MRCGLPCEGCNGRGVRYPAEPSCSFLPGNVVDWVLVEKCDTCDRCPDDLAAAERVFCEAKWVACAQGGQHAVGRKPRAKSVVRYATESEG